jgi:hypothetical protein
MQLQKIEIDFDIHKLIESERRGFDEPPHLALRRLLKLPNERKSMEPDFPETGIGVAFFEDGVAVPHGSLAKMEYQRGRQIYNGQFLNGKLVVNGQSFSALSAAASALAVTKNGGKTSLNGWLYWKVRFPNEIRWKSLADLREKNR